MLFYQNALMVRKDRLWKGIIEDLIEDFLMFFFPEIFDQIDFDKGIIFLDTELNQLSPESVSIKRHADKLFKVYFKDQKEHWFLIHVEVQGYADQHFALRMFQYAYRIKDRFKRPITALAIYTNENRKYHFKEYRESFLTTEIVYKFQTFVLIDFTAKELRQTNNLFALVLEIALQELILKKRKDIYKLFEKTEIVRHLFKRGVSKKKITKLLVFLRFYIRFERADFFHKFEKEIQLLTKTKKAMGIEEEVLNYFKEKAWEEGMQQGIQQGLQQGMQEGLEQGKEEGFVIGIRTVILRAYQKGMKLDEIADLTNLPIESVAKILNAILLEEQDLDEEE